MTFYINNVNNVKKKNFIKNDFTRKVYIFEEWLSKLYLLKNLICFIYEKIVA